MAVKSEPQTTKVTLGRVLAWTFGVFFLLGGLGNIKTPLFAIPVILAGLVLLPPIRSWAAKRWHVELSSGLLVVAVVVLLGISMANMPAYEAPPVVRSGSVDAPPQEVAAPIPSKVRRASITLDRVVVSSGNLYPLRVTVQNTGDVAVVPKFDVSVTDASGREVCAGSPLFDEFSPISPGQQQTGEFTILSCMFTEDGTYTVTVDLLDDDYAKLANDSKDVTVTYWSVFT